MRAIALSLLLALPALAGCVTQSVQPAATLPLPAKAMHLVQEVVAFEAKAADGVALAGHVYLPDGPPPYATVLDFSPYWSNAAPATDAMLNATSHRMTGRYGNLTDAGFAVALVNVRGTGRSGGCFIFMSPADADDVRAVVDQLAAQPWSNGNVGMFGVSYDGWTQDVAVRNPSPHLKALVPISGVPDLWAIETRHGAPATVAAQGPDAWTLGTGLGLFSIVGTNLAPPAAPALPVTSPDHACPEAAAQLAEANLEELRGDKGPWARERDNLPAIRNSTIPMFSTNGLTDGEFHILEIDGLWDAMPANKRLLIGQWPHGSPTAQKHDFPQMAAAWFDHWLRGGPDVVKTGVVEYQDDALVFHTTDRWPPRAHVTTLHLDGDKLALAAGQGAPQTMVSMEGTNADLTRCGPWQAVWTSPPLAEDVLLAGNFVVNVTLTSTAPNGVFAAYLFHTAGNGGCPDAGAKEVRRALTDLRHRGHLEVGEDFPVGTPGLLTVPSLPFASPVHKGERLVLVVAGADDGLASNPMKPILTTEGGTVELPAAEGALRFEA